MDMILSFKMFKATTLYC